MRSAKSGRCRDASDPPRRLDFARRVAIVIQMKPYSLCSFLAAFLQITHFKTPSRTSATVLILITILSRFGLQVFAADAPSGPVETGPSGTWKWGWTTPAGQTIDMTLRIRKDPGEFSGFVLGRNNAEIPLKKVSFENNEIQFEVSRDKEGKKSPARYKGHLEGNKIVGTMEIERDGEKRVRDWEAIRQPEQNRTRRPGINGIWRYKVRPVDNDAIDLSVRLRLQDGKLSGTNRIFDDEVDIRDASFKDGEVKFTVVREWEGRPYTSTYVGKMDGERIKGVIETDFGGKPRKLDWDAYKD